MYNRSVSAYFALALVQHSDHSDTQRIPLLLHDGNDSDKNRKRLAEGLTAAGCCARGFVRASPGWAGPRDDDVPQA